MGASVRIEQQAFTDPRFEILGNLLGADKYAALGRLAHLWAYCTERNSEVVPESIVEVYMGTGGASRLVMAELAEPVEAGGFRIKGTRGRIEWLENKRAAGRDGARRRWGSRGTATGGADGDRSQTDSTPMGDARPRSYPPTPTPTPTLDLSSSPVGDEGDEAERADRSDVKPQKSPREQPREALLLADRLCLEIQRRQPDCRELQSDRWERTRQRWADSFRLAHERDGRDWHAMRELLDWSQRDAFWSGNILSADTFRRQYDKLAAHRNRGQTAPAQGRHGRVLSTERLLEMANEEPERAAGGGS